MTEHPEDSDTTGQSYTGQVQVNGDWQDQVDGPLLIRKFAVSDMANNVYVLACRDSGSALLVDVADNTARIGEAIAGFSVIAAVQTHGHWDHVRAWDGVRDGLGIEVWGHDADAALFPRRVDRELTDGEQIAVGNIEVTALHVPGHTEGSMLYLVAGASRLHLIAGDTLFPGGPGKTKTSQDHQAIMDGLETTVFGRLPDDTWVYPGHGDDTTLGAERPHLAAWRARGW